MWVDAQPNPLGPVPGTSPLRPPVPFGRPPISGPTHSGHMNCPFSGVRGSSLPTGSEVLNPDPWSCFIRRRPMPVIRRSTLLFSLVTLLAIASGCSDREAPSQPAEEGTLRLGVQMSAESWGASAPISHDLIRIRAIGSGGVVLRRLSLSHSGSLSQDFGPFQIQVGSEPVTLERVEVEVVGGSAQSRVLWSGVVHDVTLEPGSVKQASITVYPAGQESRTLSGISISSPVEELGIGEEFALSASGQEGSVEGAFWGSLDPQVASVTGDGRVRGLGVGTARLVVAAGTSSDTLQLSTRERAEEIRITPDSLSFTHLRESRRLSVEVIDFRGERIDAPEVEWSSSASGVVQVDPDGRALSRSAGDVEVTARVGARSATIPASVVQTPDHILVLPMQLGVQLGQSLALNASVRDRGGERIPSATISLATGDSSIARIEAGERIRGVSPGETTLSVAAGGLERTVDLAVFAGDPAAIQLVSGGGQSAVVGEQLANPVRVRIIDGSGFPVPGASLEWEAQGEGIVEATGSSTADAEGELSVHWRLDVIAGPRELTAGLGELETLVIQASARPGAPATVVAIQGDEQSGLVAETLPESLVAEVRDVHGNVVPGAGVRWTGSGDGHNSPTPTDARGRSTVEWALGTAAGTQNMRARVDGLEDSSEEALFTAQALPGPADAIQITPAVLSMNADQSRSVSARVVDAFGNRLPDQAVSWSSDDENVASIAPAGTTVQAVWEGQTEIRVSSGSLEGQAMVEVAEVLPNGSFEDNEGVGSSTFAHWVVLLGPNSPRDWFAHPGGPAPLSGRSIPSPPTGTVAALVDQGGPGYSLLYRDVYIPSAAQTLEFDLFYDNSYSDFHTPESFTTHEPHYFENQQFRVDITDPTADPTAFGAAILATVFRTDVGDPPTTEGVFITVSADVSAFQGQTVRLRFGEAVYLSHLSAAVDDVRLIPGF
ncbi:MAG: Ig-like domain-containing protein [Gemmatimonadales bacterium]|nr:MAG: Ig-like domain-containing protein [Gemmatimonadales bacterium]